MSPDTNLIIGNGPQSIIKTNTQNQRVETVQILNVAEILEENIEDTQRFATKIGEPLRGNNIDVFG